MRREEPLVTLSMNRWVFHRRALPSHYTVVVVLRLDRTLVIPQTNKPLHPNYLPVAICEEKKRRAESCNYNNNNNSNNRKNDNLIG
jgi:hypothetical protein